VPFGSTEWHAPGGLIVRVGWEPREQPAEVLRAEASAVNSSVLGLAWNASG
jgi:hypothetical protein